VPIVRYCGYTVSRNNHHDMRKARQSSELNACFFKFLMLARFELNCCDFLCVSVADLTAIYVTLRV